MLARDLIQQIPILTTSILPRILCWLRIETLPDLRQFQVMQSCRFSGEQTIAAQHRFRNACPLSASSRRLALELLCALVLYDALFFAFHLAMHALPGIRSWHRPHHSHGEMQPQITNQLHVFERMGLVLLANFSLNIIGSHVLTRTLFVPIFVWLLIELHSGLDLPWAYDKILPMGWGGGARKHASHHKDGSGGLEPYFNWLDWCLECWTHPGHSRPDSQIRSGEKVDDCSDGR